jgi:hypothetical protein
MSQESSVCIVCGEGSQHVPLMPFVYHGEQYAICPQHLPILIHKPASLADRLPGLELLGSSGEH